MSATTGSPAPTLAEPAPSVAITAGRRWRDLFALTKPRIVELLLVTAVPTMVVAGRGWPGTSLVLATIAGGALTAGCANALNNVVEHDRDTRMRRTRNRAIAAGRVSRGQASVFAAVLGVVGTVLLWVAATPLAAATAVFAIVFYATVYTMWAKPRTSQAVVIGGIAGSMPVLTGWAAVTGDLASPVVWALFAVLFLWQPPHFWALAMVHEDDYRAAAFPMLPVQAGARVAMRHSLAYIYVTVAAVGALAVVSGSWLVAAATAPVAVHWLRRGHQAVGRPDHATAAASFHASLTFLTVVFVASPLVLLGPLLPGR